MAHSNGRKSIGVMAKYMHMFFPENKAVNIDVCDLVAGIVEGTMDNGESSFSFKASRAQILELLECTDKTKVLTVQEKKEKPELHDDPPPAVVPSVDPPREGKVMILGSMAPSAVTPVTTAGKLTIQGAPKPIPPLGFIPPTQLQKTDRQRLTKPGEQELMTAFEKSWPNKYQNRRKLEPHEEKEKAARDHAIDVARSYILSGDRSTVKTWVEYNNAMMR